MSKINNPKSSKLINGKKITLVLNQQASQALDFEMKKTKKGITEIVEKALLLKSEGLSEEIFEKIVIYMRIHNKVYNNLNATFSNINQIAYHLNLENFLGTKKIDDNLLKKTLKELKDSSAFLSELRVLILKVHILLTDTFGTKEEKNILEKKFYRFLKKIIIKEAVKRGLIEEYVIDELSDGELRELIEQMEDF